MLLSQGSEVETQARLGQTALHVAASNRALRCAETLVPLMRDINITDRNGRTALHHAAYIGDTEVPKSDQTHICFLN